MVLLAGNLHFDLLPTVIVAALRLSIRPAKRTVVTGRIASHFTGVTTSYAAPLT